MDYFFLFLCQMTGIGFHVWQKINQLDRAYPEKSIDDIRKLFFENEWSSLGISAMVVFADLLTHVIINVYVTDLSKVMVTLPVVGWTVPYIVAAFALSFVLGYGGQRISYKYLGKFEEYLSNKADNR